MSSNLSPQHIIQKGSKLKPLERAHRTEDNRVLGCQSIMYLHAYVKDNVIHYSAQSDALISAGLAALLIEEMEGKSPEEILKTKEPQLMKQTEGSLSPGRSNGLASLWLKMKQQALAALI